MFGLFSSEKLRIALAAGTMMAGVGGAQAGAPVSYYNSANTASGATLRSSLNDIISAGFSRVGYSNSEAALNVIDEDPANSSNVLLMYSRQSRSKNAGSSQNGDAATGGWNKEHTWPQSSFNENEPMRSDIHALMPCDSDTNNYRSNYPYQVVTNPSYTDVFGNKDNNINFEPANIDKGRAARAILYMDVRYEGESGEKNLVVINSAPGGTGAGQMAYLNTLLAWHIAYPPDAWERVRNQKGYNRQRNANPFVDHPEWVATIFGGTAWTMANGDTLTVTGQNRAPVANQSAGAQDIPLLTLNLNLAANQFHVNTISMSKLGTIADNEVAAVKLWWDVDNDGMATTADVLLDTRTFAAGTATFTLSHPFFVAKGDTKLLVTGSLSTSIAGSRTFGVRANGSGITHHASGGADITPAFSNIDSGQVNIVGAYANGDTLSGVSFVDRSSTSAEVGEFNVPLVGMTLTAATNEWDLGSVDVTQTSSAADLDIDALNLILDNNNNGIADSGEPLLASAVFSGGNATLSLSPAYRLLAGAPRNFLITADVADTAMLYNGIRLRVNANGIHSSPSGGTDVDPANPAFESAGTLFVPVIPGDDDEDPPTTSTWTKLLISEVFEGTSGNLKFVEFYNPTGAAISLNDYTLRKFGNGGTSATNIPLSGSVAAGGYFVIANNSTDFTNAFSGVSGVVYNANVNHNGNEEYQLYNNTTSSVVDTFGGDRIGNAADFAKDIVAMRKLDIPENDGSWGGTQPPANGDSPSGYWATRVITGSNGNATTVANPGAFNVPVTMSAFSID